MKPEEAIAFLLDGQLLTARDLVQGEVRVEDHSSRHRSLAVHCTTRPGYFVKQAPRGDVLGTLDTEATFYALVAGDSRLGALRPFVPEFHAYDGARQLLVLGLVADGTTLRGELFGTPGKLDETQLAGLSEQLGRILASCHAAGTENDQATRGAFQRMLPWAFQVALPEPEVFRDVGPLQLDLIRLVQGQGDIADGIRALRRDWQYIAFTHGDVRWTNVLVESPSALRLLDWEAAGLADPAWDIACGFEEWLSAAVEALELGEGDGPAEASTRFADALPGVQRRTRGLWKGYTALARLDAGDREDLLRRATAYTGVRLLQSAYEWAGGRTAFTPFVLLTVQLAVNMLRRSPKARAEVLGIARA